MSDNYEQWSQRFMLSIGENPYASPLWDNANLDEDDISVPVPGNWEILKRSPWVHYHPQNIGQSRGFPPAGGGFLL